MSLNFTIAQATRWLSASWRPWLAAFLFGLLLWAPDARAQAPAWLWANGPVRTAQSASTSSSTAVDAAGNVYVTGIFYGTATFGGTTLTSAGTTDVYVAKLSSSGTYQWAVRAGGTQPEYSTALAVDASGNVFVAGTYSGPSSTFGTTTLTNPAMFFNEEMFVAKLSTAGAWLWARSAGGDRQEYAKALACDAAGNVLLTGEFDSAVINCGAFTLNNSDNSGFTDVFVAKLDPAGTWQWATSASSPFNRDQSNAVAVDAGGNAYVTGYFHGAMATFGSTTLASSGLGAEGEGDVFVAKLNPAGTWLWAVRAGGPGGDHGTALALAGTGDLIVSGHFNGPTVSFGATTLTNNSDILPGSNGIHYQDLFVARLSAAGTWQWAVGAGAATDEHATALGVDAAGNAYVTGYFNSATVAFGATTLSSSGAGLNHSGDVFVARLSAAGAWQWATSAGGTGHDKSFGLAVDAGGSVYVSGEFSSPSIRFGATTFTSSNRNFQAFVGRLAAQGLPVAGPSSLPAFRLFPNPARQAVQVQGGAGGPVQLLDACGRVLTTVTPGAGAAALDVSGLPAGLYLVRDGAATRRLVVGAE